ncbi:MAG: sulfurtransferase complex subunit TusD [Pseudomonadota bacterium]
MVFSLLINAGPQSAASYSAYQFVKALLEQGHAIYRVFFYCDGVYHGSTLHVAPQDELNLSEQWQSLALQDKVICIAAGLKRGIIDDAEAARYQKPASNLAAGMDLSGLGQLVDAAHASDRMLTFGA